MENNPTFMELIETLFKHGLSELPVLYTRANGTYLGYMIYEKGHLAFMDSGIFNCTLPQTIEWEKNAVGMVCYREMLTWKSLSFYGVDYCRIQETLNQDLKSSLMTVENEYGDRLYDFVGSIYRAYRLLLTNNFLPVVLLKQLYSTSDKCGLLIGNLHAAPLPEDVLIRVDGLLNHTLDRRMTLELSELAA